VNQKLHKSPSDLQIAFTFAQQIEKKKKHDGETYIVMVKVKLSLSLSNEALRHESV
jgi:hypothetical protein